MGVENCIFWSKQGQDLVNRAAYPHQEYLLPPPGCNCCEDTCELFKKVANSVT